MKESAMKIPTEVAWYSLGSDVSVSHCTWSFRVAVCQTFESGEEGMWKILFPVYTPNSLLFHT